jgi:hypothetical protein
MSAHTLTRLYDAWNRVDIDAGIGVLHPEVEIHMSGVDGLIVDLTAYASWADALAAAGLAE